MKSICILLSAILLTSCACIDPTKLETYSKLQVAKCLSKEACALLFGVPRDEIEKLASAAETAELTNAQFIQALRISAGLRIGYPGEIDAKVLTFVRSELTGTTTPFEELLLTKGDTGQSEMESVKKPGS